MKPKAFQERAFQGARLLAQGYLSAFSDPDYQAALLAYQKQCSDLVTLPEDSDVFTKSRVLHAYLNAQHQVNSVLQRHMPAGVVTTTTEEE